MKTSEPAIVKKLSGDERRASIIQAARAIFANKGFKGTTTRELAAAAGVSEALIFKHFADKEELYGAMLHACCNDQDFHRLDQIIALEPSALKLVRLVHAFLAMVLQERDIDGDKTIHCRLMIRSLLEDGEFVRLFFQSVSTGLEQSMLGSVQAAIAAGDAYDGPLPPQLGYWFCHHLVLMLKTYMLPATDVLDYGSPHEKVVQGAVWFSLRGFGIKEEVICRLYHPNDKKLFGK